LSSSLHSQYLFPSPLTPAQPIQGRNFVVKAYMPVLERAGIQGATWHTLRHTFASRAVMGGVDIRTVQELMGLSTVTMTCVTPIWVQPISNLPWTREALDVRL